MIDIYTYMALLIWLIFVSWVITWELIWTKFAGPFSRSAVNFNAGCKTAVSNIVMAIALMITLLFLTPFFHYTPLVVLSSIIITAMLGLINYEEVIHLWKIDKFDFVVCLGAYIGVVFGSVETGLIVAVSKSIRWIYVCTKNKFTTMILICLNWHCYSDRTLRVKVASRDREAKNFSIRQHSQLHNLQKHWSIPNN